MLGFCLGLGSAAKVYSYFSLFVYHFLFIHVSLAACAAYGIDHINIILISRYQVKMPMSSQSRYDPNRIYLSVLGQVFPRQVRKLSEALLNPDSASAALKKRFYSLYIASDHVSAVYAFENSTCTVKEHGGTCDVIRSDNFLIRKPRRESGIST